MPLLWLIIPQTPAAAWQPAGLPGRNVQHVAAGFADGIYFYYAWTPTDGLLMGHEGAVSVPTTRRAWRAIDGNLPARSLWGAPVVRRLAVDDRNGRHLLVSLAAGSQSGLYSSNDGGATWQLTRSFAGSEQDPALAVGPAGSVFLAANQRLLWNLDTGRIWQQTATWSAEAGAAVALLVSVEQAAEVSDRRLLPALFVGASNGFVLRLASPQAERWEESRLLAQGPITLLTQAPSQPAQLYAWGGATLFASPDAGVTWTAVYQAAETAQAEALVVAPADPATLYLALADTGVRVSFDGGLSWQTLGNGRHPARVHRLILDRRQGSLLLAATDQGIWRYPTAR